MCSLNVAAPDPLAPSMGAGSLHDLLDALPSLVLYVDATGRNRYANRAATSWLGFDPEETVGLGLAELLGEREYELVRPLVEDALEGEPQQFERTLVRHDGVPAHTQTEYLPRIRDGRPDGFYVLVTDVSRQAQAEAAHQHTVVRAALLQERNRMAAEVNDVVLQRLFAIGMYLERIRRSSDDVAGAVEPATRVLQDTVDELRRSIGSLLMGQGSVATVGAVERTLVLATEGHDIERSLVIQGTLPVMEEEAAVRLLEVLAEVLACAVRHRATAVMVTVTTLDEALVLDVVVDGSEAVARGWRADLDLMHARVTGVGGTLTYSVRPHRTVLSWRQPRLADVGSEVSR